MEGNTAVKREVTEDVHKSEAEFKAIHNDQSTKNVINNAYLTLLTWQADLAVRLANHRPDSGLTFGNPVCIRSRTH